MERIVLKERNSKCGGTWYPFRKSRLTIDESPLSPAVISPHAGFSYSGTTSLQAVSNVKKNRIWFFGTSHYEDISAGLSVYPGDYNSSIGKALFPTDIGDKEYNTLKKYLSTEGHRTEEHSLENVLYSVNHFNDQPFAFCGLVRMDRDKDFESVSDDIASLWHEDDSIIVSTDWNHFVSSDIIDKLMSEVSALLNEGKIKELYNDCQKQKYEACGIDSLYLASRVLDKVNVSSNFSVIESTDSSKVRWSRTCVGYIAAKN